MIVTDLSEAYVVYTLKLTDPTLFDPVFEQALVHYLESKLAVPVVGGSFGRQMKADAIGLYQQTLSQAVAQDQNEQKRPKRRPAAAVRARLRGAY